ncbi:MAG: hypothetical protein KDA28_01730, partial [Phycisphaerales bacterium]|nr:hypothetical protein [Phycisphaerales bacterium]
MLPAMERRADERGLSFLVISSPKSGSQWVSAMCRAHPDVECAESRLFGNHLDQGSFGVRLTLDAYVHLLRQHHRSPGGDAYYDALLHDLVDTIGRTSRRVLGVTHYGEKITPFAGTGRAVVERCLAYDPDLPIVHLVR